MATCEYCGSSVADEIRVCPYCAAPIPEKKKAEKTRVNAQFNSQPYANSYNYNQNMNYANFQNGNVPKKDRTSDIFAVVSLVIGLVSFAMCCFLGGFIGIVGVIFGIMALADKQCNRRVLAIIGLVVSAVTFVGTIGLFILGVFGG